MIFLCAVPLSDAVNEIHALWSTTGEKYKKENPCKNKKWMKTFFTYLPGLFFIQKTYKNKILMWSRGGGGKRCILNEDSRLNQEIVECRLKPNPLLDALNYALRGGETN